MSVRVLLADDHEVVRQGLISLLAGSPVKVVGEAASGLEVPKLTSKLKPDVVLLDLRMGVREVFDVVAKVRKDSPKVKVVILTGYENPTFVARAVAYGASDYLLKGCTRQVLIQAIVGAAEGKGPSPAGELLRVAGTLRKLKAIEGEVALTPREAQTLRHLALGLSNREIGRSMQISVETVKEHVQNLLRKLGFEDRTQAAVWAVRKKLV